MRGVHDHLGVGQVVQRRDRPVTDADALVDDVDHRRQAVGRARRGGHHGVHSRVVATVVDAHDHVQRAWLFDRCCHDDLVDPAFEVRRERLHGAELARSFDHDIDAVLVPRHLTRGGFTAEADRRAVDGQRPCVAADVTVPAAVDRVERQQVSRGLGVPMSSLTCANWNSGQSHAARSASRPIRPKPLIPIRVAAISRSTPKRPFVVPRRR